MQDQRMIDRMREFNRFYTVWLDVLNKGYLGSSLTWTESRTLFEIYQYPGISATGLCEHLHLDKSYTSRMLGRFEKNRLLTRKVVPGSKGLKQIWLTPEGEAQAVFIDQHGSQQIIDKMAHLNETDCQEICAAMEKIQRILERGQQEKECKDHE